LLQEVGDIDRDVLRSSLGKRSTEDSRVLKYYLSQASWSNAKLYEAGLKDSPKCELCGHGWQDTMHLMHQCPAMSEARQQALGHLPDIEVADLPIPIQLGLPLPLTCTAEGTYWGTDWKDLQKPAQTLVCFHNG
jgi:hypothetical protein